MTAGGLAADHGQTGETPSTADPSEADLLDRRARAEAERWLGEIEGIDLTLQFLRQKRADTARVRHRSPVHLGLPQPR